MTRQQDLGRAGENEASKFFLSKGFIILEKNWRHGSLEVDLVVKNENRISLVEVKTRRTKNQSIDEILTSAKEENLKKAADAYMQNRSDDEECQIDFVLIWANETMLEINHIENVIT